MFDTIGNLLGELLEKILSVLPDSPFTYITQTAVIYKYLQIINWVIPVSFFVSTLEAWLIAYVGYLVYSLILRWAKAIE